jgi:hypothetical protein
MTKRTEKIGEVSGGNREGVNVVFLVGKNIEVRSVFPTISKHMINKKSSIVSLSIK